MKYEIPVFMGHGVPMEIPSRIVRAAPEPAPPPVAPPLWRQVELYIERHPGCTARQIASGTGATTNVITVTLARLREKGTIRRREKTPTERRVCWEIGGEAIMRTRQTEGEARRVYSSEWEPHHRRDELTAALFGRGNAKGYAK